MPMKTTDHAGVRLSARLDDVDALEQELRKHCAAMGDPKLRTNQLMTEMIARLRGAIAEMKTHSADYERQARGFATSFIVNFLSNMLDNMDGCAGCTMALIGQDVQRQLEAIGIVRAHDGDAGDAVTRH